MKMLPVLFLLFCPSLFAENMRAHFIDIGQGDATLLEFNCGVVMIDAGTETFATRDGTRRLMTYLEKFFERRSDLDNTIDSIIVTHNHRDHTGSLDEVYKEYQVNNLVSTEFNLNSEVRDLVNNERPRVTPKYLTYAEALNFMPNGIYYQEIDPLGIDEGCGDFDPQIIVYSGEVDVGDGITIDGRHFEQEEIDDTPNNHSLVVKVLYGRTSFLFTGDLERPGIEYLLANYRNSLDVFDVDVYQVGHHGSSNATRKELLDAMTPAIAVISASKSTDHDTATGWAYGHPNKGVVEMLQGRRSMGRRSTIIDGDVFRGPKNSESIRINKDVYCTCWDGHIVISANPQTGRYRVLRNQ